jgi:hypothetical protein
MTDRTVVHWIRAGLLALPVHGLLTAWASLEPQPDAAADPEGWARFVSSSSYLVGHLVGSTGGTILAILGTFALGAHLTGGRSARLALPAMVLAVTGHALLLVPAVMSTFALPALGRAYLSGTPEVVRVEFPDALTAATLLGLLLALVGHLLLGAAIWRSGVLPRGAGALWAFAAVVFYVLGVVLGMATTGASLPTQVVGALLLAVGGAWIAWSASFRRTPSPDASPGVLPPGPLPPAPPPNTPPRSPGP